MRNALSILALLLLAACGGHDASNAAPGSDTHAAAAAPSPAATTKRIRVIFGPLPAGTEYKFIEAVHVGSGWWGALADAEHNMADRARKLDADAIINAKTWFQPSGLAWAAPFGSGDAVKLVNPDSVDLDAVPGQWR